MLVYYSITTEKETAELSDFSYNLCSADFSDKVHKNGKLFCAPFSGALKAFVQFLLCKMTEKSAEGFERVENALRNDFFVDFSHWGEVSWRHQREGA